ncbi:MAG: PH domain-containing protein [Hyphomonadaceae bacterium]|nr:PH domain-containing protein [Hyphomonadaceae bacterium]
MRYVEAVLSPGERIVHQGRLHWVYWLRAIASLVFLGILIIGVIWFVRDIVFLTTTEIALTNQRLIEKRGFVARHARELQLSSVEVVELDQGVWGRLLGFGKVSVHGTGDDVWVTPLIAHPVAFRRDLEAALSSVAARRGGKPARAEKP